MDMPARRRSRCTSGEAFLTPSLTHLLPSSSYRRSLEQLHRPCRRSRRDSTRTSPPPCSTIPFDDMLSHNLCSVAFATAARLTNEGHAMLRQCRPPGITGARDGGCGTNRGHVACGKVYVICLMVAPGNTDQLTMLRLLYNEE